MKYRGDISSDVPFSFSDNPGANAAEITLLKSLLSMTVTGFGDDSRNAQTEKEVLEWGIVPSDWHHPLSAMGPLTFRAKESRKYSARWILAHDIRLRRHSPKANLR